MMRDYSYSYEWDREYCYPNSNVLINKLNIQDAESLHMAEREITSLRLAAAKMQLIKGRKVTAEPNGCLLNIWPLLRDIEWIFRR